MRTLDKFKDEAAARLFYKTHNSECDPTHVNEGRFVEDCKKKGFIEETNEASAAGRRAMTRMAFNDLRLQDVSA